MLAYLFIRKDRTLLLMTNIPKHSLQVGPTHSTSFLFIQKIRNTDYVHEMSIERHFETSTNAFGPEVFAPLLFTPRDQKTVLLKFWLNVHLESYYFLTFLH